MKYLMLLLVAIVAAVPGYTTYASTNQQTNFETQQQIRAIINQLNELIITKSTNTAIPAKYNTPITSGSVAGVSTTATSETLLVQSDLQTVFTTSADLTSAEAYKICEDHAYALENYFKNVTCEHLGELIYDYTFIPG